MVDRLFLLDESDREALRSMLDEFKQRKRNTKSHDPGKIDHEEHQAPEVYIARVPDAGIPGATLEAGTGAASFNDSVNSSLCDIYRIQKTGSAVNMAKVYGLQKEVFNVTPSAIEGGQWVIVERDKFGDWIASAPAPGGLSIERSEMQADPEDCTCVPEPGTGTGYVLETDVRKLRFNGCSFKVEITDEDGIKVAEFRTEGVSNEIDIDYIDWDCVERNVHICAINGLIYAMKQG